MPLQVHDPWRAYDTARDSAALSARRPFNSAAEKPRGKSRSITHRSPRAHFSNGWENGRAEEQLEQQQRTSGNFAFARMQWPARIHAVAFPEISGLFAADRFRAFLKRSNARKPDWL